MQTLREIRESRGLTQGQVAEALEEKGKSYRSGRRIVSQWEKGNVRPALSTIPTLAAVLGVSVEKVVEAVEACQSPPLDASDPEKPP
jgi:transcriptional regulator with XRE-family HTH domain